MGNTFVSRIIIGVAILSTSFIGSCSYDTVETTDKTSIALPGDRFLVVEKTNKETTATGLFTKHNYGTTHRFSYTFALNPGKIKWNGGSGEPKHIIFCNDTTYIRYLKKKSIRTEVFDSISNTTIGNYHDEIQESFEKHIDKRYFFKLLGDDYWIEVSDEQYNAVKNSCEEYRIPNDNELSIFSPLDQ